MSQINLNGGQPQQISATDNTQQAQEAQQGNALPPELRNARPSPTQHASILRSIGNFFAYIGHKFMEGIRSLGKLFASSPTPPQPQVRAAHEQTGQLQNPDAATRAASRYNTALRGNIWGKQPQKLNAEFLQAGNTACADIAQQFNGFGIKSMADLCNDTRCVRALCDALSPLCDGKQGKITAEQFGTIVRQTMFQQAKLTMLSEVVSQALEAKGEKPNTKLCFNLARNVLANNPALNAQFEKATTLAELTRFFENVTEPVGKAIALHEKLPEAKARARDAFVDKLANLLQIPKNEVESTVKLSELNDKLEFLSSSIANGTVQVTLSYVQDRFNEVANKFFSGVSAMLEEFDKADVSPQQKAKWKADFLRLGGKRFPKDAQMVVTAARVAKQANVTALVQAVRDARSAQEIYKLATDLSNALLRQALQGNEQLANVWHNPDIIGGDEQLDFFNYIYDAIFDAHPELREVFADKANLVEELSNLQFLSQRLDVNLTALESAERKVSSNMMSNFVQHLMGFNN